MVRKFRRAEEGQKGHRRIVLRVPIEYLLWREYVSAQNEENGWVGGWTEGEEGGEGVRSISGGMVTGTCFR